MYWFPCEMYFLLSLCCTHYRVILSSAKHSQDCQGPHLAPVYLGAIQDGNQSLPALAQHQTFFFSGGPCSNLYSCPGIARVWGNEIFIRTVGEPPWHRDLIPHRSQYILKQFHTHDLRSLQGTCPVRRVTSFWEAKSMLSYQVFIILPIQVQFSKKGSFLP